MKSLERLENFQNSGNNKFLLFLTLNKNIDKKVILCYNIFEDNKETKYNKGEKYKYGNSRKRIF